MSVLVKYIFSFVKMSWTCFSTEGFSVFLNTYFAMYIEDRNPLLYLWYTLWMIWYICASILRLLILSLLKCIFVPFTCYPLKFWSILQGPNQILFPPKRLPKFLRWNEAYPLPHYPHLVSVSCALASICFRRKLSSFESSHSVLLTLISLMYSHNPLHKTSVQQMLVVLTEIKTI